MTDQQLSQFLEQHLAEVEPLSRDINLAYWQASITGKASHFDRCARLQIRLQRIYANRREFETLRQWDEDATVTDDLLKRQLKLLVRAYRTNQIDAKLNERMTTLASETENKFNVFRADVSGKTLTSNDILDVLRRSNDSRLRERVWKAGKAVGKLVERDVLELARLRNQAAQSLGFENFYTMSLELSEQKADELEAIFDELDDSTREPFREMKDEVDSSIANRFGLTEAQIRPWHYEDPFFQEAPRVADLDLDGYYRDRNVVEVTGAFFRSIGLDAEDILANSDLYEKPNKDQHAFCTHIDRRGDIRVLANVKNDETWAGTMLHELGHAVHDKYIDPALPYFLRQEAHIFTTEAIAMLFGRLSKDPDWIQDVASISDGEKARISRALARSQKLQQLVFARWSQVMMRFEKELYRDPGADLNETWWTLVNEFQMISPGSDSDNPDWAAKTHIVSVPVYYHNYMLGELLASQLKHHMEQQVLQGTPRTALTGETAVGDYLRQRIFEPGARYRWDELILRATGEPLTASHFISEFVQ